MTALAIPMITFLPVFAKEVFRQDEITYTAFLAVPALGSITGALMRGRHGQYCKNKGRIALTDADRAGRAASAVSRFLQMFRSAASCCSSRARH